MCRVVQQVECDTAKNCQHLKLFVIACIWGVKHEFFMSAFEKVATLGRSQPTSAFRPFETWKSTSSLVGFSAKLPIDDLK